MKNKVRLILMVFAVSFLTSCASNSGVLSNISPGAEKNLTVTNDAGTVEITGQDMTTESTHWLYVECDHWSGCYMRCQGKINSCKKVTTDYKLDVDYTFSQVGPQK